MSDHYEEDFLVEAGVVIAGIGLLALSIWLAMLVGGTIHAYTGMSDSGVFLVRIIFFFLFWISCVAVWQLYEEGIRKPRPGEWPNTSESVVLGLILGITISLLGAAFFDTGREVRAAIEPPVPAPKLLAAVFLGEDGNSAGIYPLAHEHVQEISLWGRTIQRGCYTPVRLERDEKRRRQLARIDPGQTALFTVLPSQNVDILDCGVLTSSKLLRVEPLPEALLTPTTKHR